LPAISTFTWRHGEHENNSLVSVNRRGWPALSAGDWQLRVKLPASRTQLWPMTRCWQV